MCASESIVVTWWHKARHAFPRPPAPGAIGIAVNPRRPCAFEVEIGTTMSERQDATRLNPSCDTIRCHASVASDHSRRVERRGEVPHAEPAGVVEGDGHHVEAAADVAEAFPLEVLLGQADEAAPLPPLDRGPRAVVPARAPALHLDEDPDVAVAADEVELALAEPHVALDDDEARALDVARGRALRLPAVDVPRIGHGAIVLRPDRGGNVQSFGRRARRWIRRFPRASSSWISCLRTACATRRTSQALTRRGPRRYVFGRVLGWVTRRPSEGEPLTGIRRVLVCRVLGARRSRMRRRVGDRRLKTRSQREVYGANQTSAAVFQG